MARFNYASKCAHPKICLRLMKEFIEDAMTLTDEEDNPYTVVVARGKCFQTFPYNSNNYVVIHVDYQQYEHNKVGSVEFNRNIRLRSEIVKGFSDLTLSLLHELGHNETVDELPFDYDRQKAEKKIRKYCGDDVRMLNMMYFSLPDEYAATQWAIDWLSDEENRKRAKAFEKAFFKAWRGE